MVLNWICWFENIELDKTEANSENGSLFFLTVLYGLPLVERRQGYTHP